MEGMQPRSRALAAAAADVGLLYIELDSCPRGLYSRWHRLDHMSLTHTSTGITFSLFNRNRHNVVIPPSECALRYSSNCYINPPTPWPEPSIATPSKPGHISECTRRFGSGPLWSSEPRHGNLRGFGIRGYCGRSTSATLVVDGGRASVSDGNCSSQARIRRSDAPG